MAHNRILLIRHGKTPGNAEKRYIGRRTDEPLSAEGIEEAERLKVRLKEMPEPGAAGIRVFTSPMTRAVQTAEILFGNAEITKIKALEEMDFGEFEGKNSSEMETFPAYRDWIRSGGREPFPGGESRDAFVRRSFEGFLSILDRCKEEETAAVVCHGGTIMAVMMSLTGEEYFSFMTDNLSGYLLETETENERVQLVSYHRFRCGDPDGLVHRGSALVSPSGAPDRSVYRLLGEEAVSVSGRREEEKSGA